MIRYIYLILCFLLGMQPALTADSSELRGIVTDAITGEPIPGVIVKSKGGFTSTDKAGYWHMKPRNGTDSIYFRTMGYETMILPISKDFMEVRLIPKDTRLNDVIVEAPDIYARGDTLVFNVARYATAADNAIIDVIKRLPGIKVEENGTIKYQGKPINKFYLDGNDFIGGQYGLATNNISHKDVKSVEVMENHQPIKALEGIEFPEEAGINLKLKDSAKGKWLGVLQGAVGISPFLYDGSVYAMRMASRIQNIITFKGDNTGWNPANEIKEHDFNDMFSSDYVSSLWPEYISADMVSTPLAEKRTRDNLSWLGNVITAWKTGDNSMRLKLNYMGDRLDYNSGQITDYFSPNIPDFVQNNKLHTNKHDFSAQFNSVTNKRDFFLKDKLTVKAVWDHSVSQIKGSFDIDQRVKRKCFSVGNDLKFVRRTEKRLIQLISRNEFKHRPDLLAVAGENVIQQNIGSCEFRSTTEIQFGYMRRFWKFYVTAGIDIDFFHMNNSLSGMGDFDNSGVHDAFLSNLYATPQVDFERSGWRLSLRASLKWRHYTIAGNNNYLNTSPRFNFRRQITAKSEISGMLGYRLESSQPYLNIKVPVLADYRNLFIANNPDKYTWDFDVTMSYRYRNPLKSLFFNLSCGYNYKKSAIMRNQLFVVDFIISTYSDYLSGNERWNISGGFSKGLGHSRMVVGFDINGSMLHASSMRNDMVIPYKQRLVKLKPYFKGSLLSWMSLNYEGNYTMSQLIINNERNNYHTLRQNVFMSVIPNDKVEFTFGTENYLTRFPDGNHANMMLLDASAVWRVNNRVRLSLTGNNLLDKKSYEYVNYGILSRSESTFQIRGRNVLLSMQYRF